MKIYLEDGSAKDIRPLPITPLALTIRILFFLAVLMAAIYATTPPTPITVM